MKTTKDIDIAKVTSGPTLILAGPGTGKTHQLARRVKFLIEEQHINPWNITVITFTGEAARNMRARLSDEDILDVYVPREMQPLNIRTIHSLGYGIINEAYRKAGLRKGFVIIAERIRQLLLEDAARILGFPGIDGDLTEECRRHGDCSEGDDKKCKICKKYRELVRGLNAIDYDEQIFLARKLLKKDPVLLSRWQRATQHLLVDEYQDINEAQYQFIRQLCQGQEKGFFAVGDDDQSIYSWRGGSPKYVINFESYFGKTAKIHSLDECRRCPPHILNAALSVVTNDNPGRSGAKGNLRSLLSDDATKVHVAEVPSDKYEASMICDMISSAPKNQEAMVLVPGHRFAVPIKREMRRRGIPYDYRAKVADVGLHVIHDLIDWLKNPEDSLAFRLCLERIVLNPSLRIPFGGKGNIRQKREGTFVKIARLWEQAISERKSLRAVLNTNREGHDDLIFIESAIIEIESLWGGETEESPTSFLESASRILRPWPSLARLSEEITDYTEDMKARGTTAGEAVVHLLTMEAAKGLGCDQVYVIGLNKGIFPPDDLGPEELREKQRLLYVSMTRAKRGLHLFYARTREARFSFQAAAPAQERESLGPSPFLEWLPNEDVDYERVWPHR